MKKNPIERPKKPTGASCDAARKAWCEGENREADKSCPFKVASLTIRHRACKGGTDSKTVHCAVDFRDPDTGMRSLFCYCTLTKQGVANAKYIVNALNAVWQIGAIKLEIVKVNRSLAD